MPLKKSNKTKPETKQAKVVLKTKKSESLQNKSGNKLGLNFGSSLDLLNAIENATSDILIITDHSLKIIYTSSNFTKNNLFLPDDCNLQSIISVSDKNKFLALHKNIIENNTASIIEIRLTGADENLFSCTISGSKVNPDESKTNIIFVLKDLTQKKEIEESLKANEAKFRVIFEHSNDALGMSEKGVILFVNPACVKMFGYLYAEELHGKQVSSLIVQEHRTRVKEYIKTRARGEDAPEKYETRAIRKDGSTFDVDVSVSTYKTGKKIYTLVTLRDITSKKAQEMDMVLREEHLRLITDNIPLFVSDIDTGLRYRFVNKAYENMFGIKKEQIIGSSVRDIIGDLAFEKSLPQMEKALRGEKISFENTVLDKNNNIRVINVTYIPHQQSGKITGYYILGHDITDLKKAEQKLHDAIQLNNKTISSSPIGILAYNAYTGQCIAANESAAEIVGTTTDMLLNQNFRFIESWKECGLYKAAEYTIESDKLQKINISFTTTFNKSIWANCILNTFDNNGVKHLLLLMENVTEEKNKETNIFDQKNLIEKQNQEYLKINKEFSALNTELTELNNRTMKINASLTAAIEKAEESNRLKSAFLANISHEIRTPMNAIKGFAFLLQKENLTEDKKLRYINIINERADDLLVLINDIIDISLIESKQLSMIQQKESISNLINDVFLKWTEHIRLNKQGKLSLKVNNELKKEEDIITTDINRVKQVLNNLISNSVKFTTQGTIEMGVKKSGSNVLFYIKDNGTGIPEDFKSHIFNRFSQAEKTYLSNSNGGLGLGLSISKGIIDLLGGKLWFESIENSETIFFFTIPSN